MQRIGRGIPWEGGGEKEEKTRKKELQVSGERATCKQDEEEWEKEEMFRISETPLFEEILGSNPVRAKIFRREKSKREGRRR